MTNQHIKNAPILPNGYHWKIKHYYTPNGIVKMRKLKFNHFPQAIWKHDFDGYHLFELINKIGVPVMAYCIIVKTK